MFLLCDMSVTFVPCLVDCKSGKTPNRGQAFPYLLFWKENNGAPVPTIFVAGLVLHFLTFYAVSQLNSQHIPDYDVRVHCSCSARGLGLLRIAQTVTQKSRTEFVLPSVFCSFLDTTKYALSLVRNSAEWGVVGGMDSAKRGYYFL